MKNLWKYSPVFIIAALAFSTNTASGWETTEHANGFDWTLWRELPSQNGGRRKPLDTLSWETMRLTANRSSIVDPETGEKLDPLAWYLTVLFDWKGWEHEDHDHLLLVEDWGPLYFHLHDADRWDEMPLLRIDHLELRKKLGLRETEKYVSPTYLNQAKVVDSRTARTMPFPGWANELLKRKQEDKPFTELEEKGLELADHLWVYQNHRMGRGLEVIPIAGNETDEWMSLGHLALTSFDESNDPSGNYRKAQKLLHQIRHAYGEGDAAAFNSGAIEFKELLREFGPQLGEYPDAGMIRTEVAYNHWAPFRFAWIVVLAACLCMLLHLGSRWRFLYIGALSFYVLGIIGLIIGFAMRVVISGRAPVTNMYESVIYVGGGVALFGLIFELIYRKKYILTAAAAVSTITLLLADNCPTILDPSVRPLEPVLRSNFWLVTHVMTITLSYAAFALALGIANITLGYYVVRSSDRETISSLSRFTYKALQVGVLLLAAGVILGGVWADYSWGRFWGWDPKEVWALVALLGYLAVLHARFAGWAGHRGLAAMSVVCFSLVVMAWYGVNFVLGAGLHSYGFGGGGQGFVYSAIALQFLYVGLAMFRSGPTAAKAPKPGVSMDVQFSSSQQA